MYTQLENGSIVASGNKVVPKGSEREKFILLEIKKDPDILIKFDFDEKKLRDIESEIDIEKSLERSWRNSELTKADHMINTIEDEQGEFSGGEWRKYRNNLRKWPQNKNFPVKSKRPSAPKS